MSHHLATQHFTAQTLAAHLKKSFYTLEHGWSNVYGASWESAYQNLQNLPDDATEADLRNAIGFALLIHLPNLLCASCFSPFFHLVNLGRASATFWLCEACLDSALDALFREPLPLGNLPPDQRNVL